MARLLVTSFCLATWFSIIVSQPVLLGTLTPIFHQTSGTLYAIDEKTFFIQDFQYDGQGITVYVYVYLTGQTVDRAGGGTIINWSSTSTTVPRRRFRSENITISLTVDDSTADLNVSNIQAFTIWCEPFEVFFTRLNLPTNVNIPDSVPTIPPVVPSCVQLHSDFQVSWTHTDSHINIKQCGCIGEDQYMAFGISGSNTSTNMVGADVVVTWINDDGPNAIDYYLTSRQQCRAGQGVCPDTMISGGGGTQDVVNVTGIAVGGMRCIEYTRSLNTSDSNDLPYLVNNQTQFVAWAYGPRATEEGLRDLAFFHTEYPRNGANVELNFAESLRCGEPLQCMQETICAWEGLSITAMEPTAFTVKIGLSGGLRGYQAITGLSGWGIAYYINDTMAPVLKLRRHVTYTFIVEAGNDPNDGPRYHPFYITDSIDGGILLDSPEDRRRKNEQVYAGYNTETNEPTAAGRYCSHEETAGSESVAMDCDSTLRDYLDTLNVSCVGAESDAAILTWTPDENTPDVVYYQCANHLHLGWQIVVMNGTTNFSTGVNNNTNGTDTGIRNATDTGITAFAQEGDLRVTGRFSSQDPPFGRLEIFINSVWGTICMHNEFTIKNANTACRQLGRAEAVSFNNVTILGIDEGSGPIQLTNIHCRPTDDLIIQCPTGPDILCSHAEDVVVQCSPNFLEYDGAVRLANGSYGLLEVFLYNVWGTVCDSRFSISAAIVVCKQLGYNEARDVNFMNSGYNGPVWITSASCSEYNICFEACYSLATTDQDMQSICNHTADVSITCEYVESLRTIVEVGSAQQCGRSENNNGGGEDDEGSNSTALILGLTLGLGIPALIVLICLLYHCKAFEKLKNAFDCTSDSSSPRQRLRNVELESHPTTVPSDFYEPTDDDTSARNNYDPKKPPDYSDALTYRKPTFPDEGYPEPSLVDEPPPPSYDSVH